MRRALLSCLAIAFALACGDDITEPTPTTGTKPGTGTTAVAGGPLFATTTTEDGLSISTDKDDYQPGDVVHLTGYGWQPGDTLDIVLTDDPLTHEPHRWAVNVGADGTFHDQTYVVDEGDLNVAFTLVATSRATGRSLTVNFTDNIPAGGVTATLNGASTVMVAPGATISLAVSARVTSANPQNTPTSWQSTGWVLLTNPATTEPAGKLANCVDTPNVTGTSGNGELGSATFNITAPGTSGTYDLWLALSDQNGTGASACGGGGQSTKARFVSVVTVQVVDQTRPTVTINQAQGQNDPTNSSPINFTVVFSEPVSDFAAADVGLGGAGAAEATAAVTGSGTTYNVAVSGMTTTGPVSASLAANVAHDGAGNGNEASTSTDNTVLYDKTGPKVTIDQKSDQPNLTNRSPILFTVIFDKPIADFTADDITLGGTAHPTTAVISGGSDGMDWEVAVSGMTGDGTVTADIPADVVKDAAGNGNMAASSTDNEVTYDATEPTVTINQASGQADPTNTSPINFTVVFSEPVIGFAGDDVLLTGTAHAQTATVSTTDPDLKIYKVAISNLINDGTVIASVKAGAADDEAGNHSAASTSTDNTVTYDKTPPTVTINQAAGQADPTSATPINFTVVFSEDVIGFADGDVTLTGGTGTITATVTGTGKNYNVAVSGITSGTVVATIAAGKASDVAGNGNLASTSTDNSVTFDAAPPAVSSVAVNPNPTNGTINVTATANVDDALRGKSKITSAFYRIDQHAEVAMDASDGGFDEATETVTASILATTVAALDNGQHTVCVRGTDAAGNTSSYDDDGACATLTIDKIPPTVAINQKTGQADPTNGSTINFTVEFSEIVSDFETGDVTLDGTAGATTAAVTGSGKTYNVAVSGMSSDGTVSVTIAAGKAQDAAGNGNTASNSAVVIYDKTAPLIACGAADTDWHAVDVSIACTAEDAPAGLAVPGDASFNLITSVAAGTETANASTGFKMVSDKAGNTATAGPIAGNKVDKKAPQLALTCPANVVILNAPANANWTATDGGSGVAASGTVPLVTNSIGSKTASVTVADAVGNSASSNCGYTVGYNFSGFSAPVDRPNTMNVSKAGQAIPLKWQLKDAGGIPIDDVSSVTIKTVNMNCDAAGNSDLIEEYATTNTGLVNLGGGYYQFNWKTPTNYAGTCKSISLVFGAGGLSYIEGPHAFFSFKK